MNVLIISNFPLQGAILIDSLTRNNIKAFHYSTNVLKQLDNIYSDAILLPHPLTNTEWGLIRNFFFEKGIKVPLIFLGEQNRKHIKEAICLEKSIFIDELINEEQFVLLLKDLLNQQAVQKIDAKVHRGEITLDRHRQLLFVNGNNIGLTKKEYFLLELLMINTGQIISRERIAHTVWDKRIFVSTNTIEVYISRLRKKLRKLSNKPWIRTVSCVGYEFIV